MHITVTMNPAHGQGEMIVRRSFYELGGDEAQEQWDHHVRLAQQADLWFIEALIPGADPSDTMHIDADGTEHHYLCTPAQLNGSAKA